MNIRLLAATSCLTLWACGGGGTKEPTADTSLQDAADSSLQDKSPQDTPNPEDAPTLDSEVVEAAPLTISKGFAKALCKEVVCPAGGCGAEWLAGVDAANCQATCERELPKDTGLASKMLCARSLGGETCGGFAGCNQHLERTDACVSQCEAAQACKYFGTSRFGMTLDDCQLECLARAGASETGATQTECISAALARCDSPGVLDCLGQFAAAEICPNTLCAAPEFGACSIIGGQFDTVEACVAECDSFSPGAAYVAKACVEMNLAMPVACDTLKGACLKAQDSLPEGARAYADEVMKKCVVLEYMDMGSFGADLLAWRLTGLVMGTPGLYRPFDEALECIKQMNPCPQTQLAPWYCLYTISAESKKACEALGTMCSPEAYADEMIIQCESTLTLLHELVPELEEGKLTCLEDGKTCEEKAACISN